ncbi:uncharacterized protein BDZ99DRAFT_569388 [Mytilinidion resinicola]|uniref:Rhodopsin domain-containing protein n=1 Tax=Mytilinidion resinicola TaxID=574789 RepID=A0A6A6YTL4_9PEZI|nr:uncharacterized protein BDZ99DRAFT_569388 [Mytilinidion resinicola]KAF2811305.1 hypothetical protein BDZ99DRAFT_569388 [Mytilinidion resinicola]
MDEFKDLNHFIDQAMAASWPLFTIATIVFGMRTISRIFFTEASIGWEDYIISVSWVFDVVRMVTFQLALSATRRVDPSNLPQTVPDATFWGLFTDAWAFLSVTLPKVGVAFLLIRIFRPKPWARATIMSLALGLFAVCIAGFFICFVQCNPIAGQWNPYKYPDTKCWPRNVQIIYALVGSSSSAALDLGFAIYPGFIIWNLQLPRWKKLSTIGFMGLGIAAFAFAVVKVSSNATLLGKPTLNELYTRALHIGLWNSIENEFVLIAACLPSVRPLLKACGVFTRARVSHIAATKPSVPKSSAESQRSLNGSSSHVALDSEHALELARNKQPSRSMSQSIQVQYDFSLQRERTELGGLKLPSYNFEVN